MNPAPNSPIPPPSLTDSRHLVVWLVALLSLAAGYTLMTQLEVGIGDEDVHRFQMNLFVQGQYELFEHVTVLPLYHWVVAMLAKWTGLTSLSGFRLIHMVFAAGVIPAFYLLCRALYPQQAATRTLQFMFIPLLFPLFFVTYTDLPALMFTLLMLERTLRQKYLWAAVFALVAVAMRQPNIVWAGFAGGLIALQVAREMSVGLRPGLRHGLRNGLSGGEPGVMAPGCMLAVLGRAKYLLLVLLLFVGLVAWNGGVALGDVEQHPVSLNLSNLYFCLMVAFVLFLPFNLGQLGNIGRLLRSHWWLLPVLFACFAVYFYTYEHPHKYNSPELEFYRHNVFIHYTSDFTTIRVLAFIPMAWMVLSYVTAARASDYSAEMVLMLPFVVLSVVPLPLIEPRYYLVAFSLFLAFRPGVSVASTVITLVYYVAVSAYVLLGVSRQLFFL